MNYEELRFRRGSPLRVRGNRHWLHQFLCWSGGESLYPEGGHSALGWNDLGGHSTLGQNDRGSFYSGGHSTFRQRYVGLARAVSPTNTNFRLTFLLTRLQEALYEDLAV